MSTCSTTLPGNPRKTRRGDIIPCPKVAESYLKYAASIDVHNHTRTGSLGLEDAVQTKSPHIRQVCGITGFIFTNAYLAYRFFKPDQSNLKHIEFKAHLGTAMVKFRGNSAQILRSSISAARDQEALNESHVIISLAYSKPCYICRHGSETASKRQNTTFGCESCKVPLCKPSSKPNCWNIHMKNLPPKRRYSKI